MTDLSTTKIKQTKDRVAAARELARRYVEFHDGKDWQLIKLWGLGQWGSVSKLIKSGELITTMRKEHKTIWYYPSEDFYNSLVIHAIAEYRQDTRPNKSQLWFEGNFASANIPII